MAGYLQHQGEGYPQHQGEGYLQHQGQGCLQHQEPPDAQLPLTFKLLSLQLAPQPASCSDSGTLPLVARSPPLLQGPSAAPSPAGSTATSNGAGSPSHRLSPSACPSPSACSSDGGGSACGDSSCSSVLAGAASNPARHHELLQRWSRRSSMTAIMVLHNFAAKAKLHLSFQDEALGPNGPFLVHAQLATAEWQLSGGALAGVPPPLRASGCGQSKQKGRQQASAALLELLLQTTAPMDSQSDQGYPAAPAPHQQWQDAPDLPPATRAGWFHGPGLLQSAASQQALQQQQQLQPAAQANGWQPEGRMPPAAMLPQQHAHQLARSHSLSPVGPAPGSLDQRAAPLFYKQQHQLHQNRQHGELHSIAAHGLQRYPSDGALPCNSHLQQPTSLPLYQQMQSLQLQRIPTVAPQQGNLHAPFQGSAYLQQAQQQHGRAGPCQCLQPGCSRCGPAAAAVASMLRQQSSEGMGSQLQLQLQLQHEAAQYAAQQQYQQQYQADAGLLLPGQQPELGAQQLLRLLADARLDLQQAASTAPPSLVVADAAMPALPRFAPPTPGAEADMLALLQLQSSLLQQLPGYL